MKKIFRGNYGNFNSGFSLTVKLMSGYVIDLLRNI